MQPKTKEMQSEVFKVSNYKCWFKGTLSQNIPCEFSFFEKTDMKEFDLLLSFADEYSIELSVINFLDTLGFDAKDDGYTYLRHIFSYYLKEKTIPTMLSVVYVCCSDKYKTSVKAVEQAIIAAIKKAVKKGKFKSINYIFNMKFFRRKASDEC